MNHTHEEIIAKAKANSEFADKILSATTTEEIVQAIRGVGIEITELDKENGQPLSDQDLESVSGGMPSSITTMSIKDLVGLVFDARIEKGGPGVHQLTEMREKTLKQIDDHLSGERMLR